MAASVWEGEQQGSLGHCLQTTRVKRKVTCLAGDINLILGTFLSCQVHRLKKNLFGVEKLNKSHK